MGIEKKCMESPLSPYTMLWRHAQSWSQIFSPFHNIVKGGEGKGWNITQIAVFPIIFVTDCLKISFLIGECSLFLRILKVYLAMPCGYRRCRSTWLTWDKYIKHLDKWGKSLYLFIYLFICLFFFAAEI